jgi:hypothetical protein
MGQVKIDIHKSERQFELVNFSDFDAVKALIKFKSMIYREGPVNPELIVLYTTLDDLIVKAHINVKQRYIVSEIMSGRTEQQIAEEDYGMKDDFSQITKILNTCVKKIVQANHLDWLYENVYVNHLKVPFKYKQCSHCGNFKPMTIDFFNKEPLGKDGFKNKCRECVNKKD